MKRPPLSAINSRQFHETYKSHPDFDKIEPIIAEAVSDNERAGRKVWGVLPTKSYSSDSSDYGWYFEGFALIIEEPNGVKGIDHYNEDGLCTKVSLVTEF